ncbi:hypothetical protein [Nocardiopsis composta]|uniref:ApbE superfamily uncharacterized protein (UPF0280 family) n=1 Tax=Nocardiopsis composta TaxID=157465 RepID=A0A7W8VEW4_9ACTN|nr:hypothetical protein [Nocardiopsis composta]MBB5433508.1 ApbE superfamily uncharacterized protein (UPF0280 family) [Nocardiopsis composta]
MALTVVSAHLDADLAPALSQRMCLVMGGQGLVFQLGPEDAASVTADEVAVARELADAASTFADALERLHAGR